MGDSGFRLLGDQPHQERDDPLGFGRIAADLAALILSSSDSTPFALGIEAPWGMGKSTLMRRLCAELEEDDRVTPVVFNAWTADDDGVLEGLVKSVLSELGPGTLRRALRNEKLVGGLRAGIGVAAGFAGLGNVVDSFWKQVASDPQARGDLRKLVSEAVADWREKHSRLADDRLLCVFIDDLDRCSPRGVLNVFEAMKLYLDVPGIVFVVGYDEDVVSDLVLRQKGYSSEAIESRDYLEKFIQIVYRIPRAGSDQSRALAESLFEQSGSAELFGDAEREIVLQGSQFNPRRVKRFINSFVLAYGLEPRWSEFEPQALIRVQLLQMYFRDFANMLERPNERDPIGEFLRYRDVREALRRHDPKERPEIQSGLKQLGLAAGEKENYDAVLARLDDRAPTVFTRLSAHEDFALLVRSLAHAPAWPRLREALEKGELPLAEVTPSRRSVAEWRLQELRLLLAVDDYERQEHVEESLWKAGASISTARISPAGLRRSRREGELDVVVLAVSRGGNVEAALDTVASLRREAVTLPPVFLMAKPIDSALELRARLLGVSVVGGAGELEEQLEGLARARQAKLSMRPYEPSG